MTKIGAAAVITDAQGRILLVHHTYGELNWEIPGGLGEDNESAETNAIREVREETGLAVAAERLVAVYFEPGRDFHHFVFACRRITRAEPTPSSPEISEVRWCDRTALPRPISDFTVRRIDDALAAKPAAVYEIGPRKWLR
ncbi:MAG TPA: NUDIX hydrolase [Candidatus Acidoferrales bacterium]|nr:NUDIX hydrolase [Candidatus Acidoferrales bacterium]